MDAQISDLAKRTFSLEQQNQQLVLQNQTMLHILQQQQTLLSHLSLQPATPAAVQTQTPVAPVTVAAVPVPPLPPMPTITPLGGSPSSRNLLHASATAGASASTAAAATARLPSARDLGMQQSYTLAGVHASQFYLDCMGKYRGNVPSPLADSRRAPECREVLQALKAMTNPEELRVLSLTDRDSEQQAHAVGIAQSVVKLFVKRILREYADKKDTKTPGHLATMPVLVNTLDKHIKSSRLDVSGTAFAAWRKDPEAPIQNRLAAMFGSSSKRPILVEEAEQQRKAAHVEADSEAGDSDDSD